MQEQLALFPGRPSAMQFFIGLHQPAHAPLFPRCMISVNRLRTRKSPVPSPAFILDSGAFTEVAQRGQFAWTGGRLAAYSEEVIRQWRLNGDRMVAVVAPDLMCEPAMIEKVRLGGPTVHAMLTVDHYLGLNLALTEHFGGACFGDHPIPLLPVLQGYDIKDYLRCIDEYGNNTTVGCGVPSGQWTYGLPGERCLKRGMWVGVGSLCKRNRHPEQVGDILEAIHQKRPDLRLHGFGVKLTAFEDPRVRTLLYSADSMAWSWSARMHGRSGNDPQEAKRYYERVAALLAA